ncbi:hypothetical protein JMJ58_14855 [Haloterrigena salifodinae]|uniref:Uncharacterized protein n=1 Tax=Haloterrigena salifodinae TaxID=2675099 RepID=A0A8T8DYA3_9EURY|nr:hypothetical protein [Haloterrigena salifodinae]QRV14213.1 hypothetical protein JMJ58_14855 [Haloterrigena salifodinae]
MHENATVTVSAYTETGETEADGMGGTQPIEDWVAIAEEIPARYSPEGRTTVNEDVGARLRDTAFVSIHPRYVGTIADDGTYLLDERLRPGIDRRVDLHRGDREPRRRSIKSVAEVPGPNGRVPSAVRLELEVVTS